MSRLETIVSRRNTTTTPLSANTSFIGEVEELSSFQELTINIAGSPNTNAPATLYLQFSPNGTNWDVTIPLVLDAPVIAPLTLRVILPYFRVRYINGSTALTQLRITTLLHRTAAKQLTRFLHQEIEANEPIENTRAVIVGQKLDGYYKHILVKDSGAITVSGVGVAGTPDSNVITIQGINSGTAVNIAGTVTSNIGTTNGLMLDSTFTSRTNTLGQKTMASSMPVVIASDQSTLPVSGTVSATQGTSPWVISAATLPLPTGAATETTLAALLTGTTFTTRINTLGQKSMANSTPVTLASDQSTLPISAASLPLPSGAATETTLSTRLSESTFTTRTNTLGQKTMIGSMPVVFASDQSALAVTGSVTANIGTTNGLALDSTLTGGTQRSIVRGGAKGTTTAADVTSISVDTNTQALHVQLADQGTLVSPLRIDPTGSTTQPISVSSLPLPAGAATETTLATRLAESTFTTRINTLGQKVMTGSTPVVLASDQTAIPIDGYVVADIGDTNGLALDATVNTLLKESTFTGRINTLGQKTMSQSTPVVLASNQSAIPVTVVDGEAGGGVSKSLYDIGATEIYIGTAAQGTASSAAAWLIKKITLDVNGNPVSSLYSSDTAVWDNRLIESYS